MAETDILNPVQGFWSELGDNPTWNYDYNRKKANNRQEQSPRLGYPIVRDIANAGHSFTWNWLNRPLATIQRLERFYENFKAGYFTVIDYDNGSRHYVGRFVEPPNVKETGNGLYVVQGLAFQERARARMLNYPGNFDLDGHTIYVIDDDGKLRVACMQGVWGPQVVPAPPSGYLATNPAVYEVMNLATALGDWAQVGYVGWGFQMVFRVAATLGFCSIALDGTILVTSLDLSTGTATGVAAPAAVTIQLDGNGDPLTVTVTAVNVFLDAHRVKVTVTNNSNASQMIFPALTYIY